MLYNRILFIIVKVIEGPPKIAIKLLQQYISKINSKNEKYKLCWNVIKNYLQFLFLFFVCFVKKFCKKDLQKFIIPGLGRWYNIHVLLYICLGLFVVI